MQNNYFKISVFIKKEEDIYYAYCSELPGCYGHGDDYEEAKKSIQEAVDLYLETLTEHEAIECLGKTPSEDTSNVAFNVELKLTSAQAEKLLLNAGFSVMASKENSRLYLKKNQRIILPVQPAKVLSQKTIKEILKLTATK